MASNDQLVIPDLAKKDPRSFEVLRVWIANEGQHVSLRTGVWDDPAAWGIMLADLARHIANSYHERNVPDRFDALQRIKDALNAELNSPTDKPSGKIVG